jgi:para-nitrobenzyl esterase
MVWIHGGGFVTGSGFDYDPTPLVLQGNVIVVTINYRLGYLGFFAHPSIDAEDHLKANYGLMDQQFALDWVRRNIGAFGGDHKRITIFGESAGGESVLVNLASPTAAGLFQGAIVESGAGANFQDYFEGVFIVPYKTGETNATPNVPSGQTIAAQVGCGADGSKQTAQCLRAVAASTLVEQEGSNVNPFIDGTLLTQGLGAAFSSGAFARVPIIQGTNHDEWRLFVAQQYGDSLTDAGYPQAVADLESGRSLTDPFVQFLVNTEYPLSNYPPPPGYSVSAPLALGALGTDQIFVCPARNADLAMAKYVPTYTYEFNDENPPFFFQPQTFPLADCHFSEVSYLFNTGLSFTPNQQQLSSTMVQYWTQFAKTGNPNVEGAPSWPLYTGAGGTFESLVSPSNPPSPPNPTTESDSSFDSDHKCSSFWNTF